MMQIAVRYYTKSGNTERLARAVAEAAGARAQDISNPLEEKAELLFLCCSYYAFDMDPAVKEFLKANQDKIGKIVCFGTSAMMKSMVKPMKRAAKPLGIEVHPEDFHCRGEFKAFHKGHPDIDDLEKAKAFVHKFLKA